MRMHRSERACFRRCFLFMTAAKAPPSSSLFTASLQSLLQSSSICFASSSEQEVASSTVCTSFAGGTSFDVPAPLLFELMAGLPIICCAALQDRSHASPLNGSSTHPISAQRQIWTKIFDA